MMIGSPGFFAFNCLQTSRPLSFGIITSSTTRSGSSERARSKPAAPSTALITSYPSYSKLSSKPWTIAGSSSTIRMRVFRSDPPAAGLTGRDLSNRPFVASPLGGPLKFILAFMLRFLTLRQAQREESQHEYQNEPAATPGCTLHFYVSAMCLGNVAYE